MSDLVPVIDIGGWESGDADTRAAIAREIDDACRRVGFLQIVGHGVPESLRAALRSTADEFFALPLEEKLRYRPPSPEVNRGYAAKGTESLAYSLGVDRPPDLFEAFNITADSFPYDEPYYAAERHRVFAPNIWPERPVAMRERCTASFAGYDRLAHRLTSIFAVALGMPEDFFEDKTNRSINVLRGNYYSHQAGEAAPAENQMRMGAHTDYGICTVLLADPVPGLQIVGPDGDWYDVLPREDGFVVNLGDALAVWTNDRWRSTLHRVVPPPPDTDGRALRRSFAFFHDGNVDALIECLPTCTSDDDPPRYDPITLGDHVMGKLLGPRTLVESSQSVQTIGTRTGVL
jgi:isopenicillin N synthase-like dioxygenase